jgi:hypothetical protein
LISLTLTQRRGGKFSPSEFSPKVKVSVFDRNRRLAFRPNVKDKSFPMKTKPAKLLKKAIFYAL